MRPSRSVSMRSLWRQRCVGWGGGCRAPINRGSPCHSSKRCWPIAVHMLVERSVGRLTGRPLSLTPMSVQRDDQAPGLVRLLSIALRVLTLLAFIGRRHLAAEGATLLGLYAGNPQRETARP